MFVTNSISGTLIRSKCEAQQNSFLYKQIDPRTIIPVLDSVDFRKESRHFQRENSRKWQDNGSSNTVIISRGEILAFMVSSGWNRKKPDTGYDHRITAYTFLPFSGIFPPDPARTLSSGILLTYFQQLGVMTG